MLSIVLIALGITAVIVIANETRLAIKNAPYYDERTGRFYRKDNDD